MKDPRIYLLIGAFALMQLTSGWIQSRRDIAIQQTINTTIETINQVSARVNKVMAIDSVKNVRYQAEKQAYDSVARASIRQMQSMDSLIKKQSYNVWKLRQTFDSLRVDLPEF